MAFSSDNFVNSLGTTNIAVAANTLQVVNLNTSPGAMWMSIASKSGGSLEILGATYGQSLAANIGGSFIGTGYLLGSTPVVIDGAPFFYLMATGATAVAQMVFGRSSGN